MYKRFRIQKSEEGQSLVEFALVLPVLLLFLLGIVEFGWLLNAQISMTSAAREGARIAAIEKIEVYDNETIKTLIRPTIKENIAYLKLDEADLIITPDLINPDKNVYLIEIKLTGNVKPLVGFFIKDELFPIKADAQMRLENYFPNP